LIQNSEWDSWSYRSLFATFEQLHKLDAERIEQAFRASSKLSHGAAIRTELREWSIRWNLNAKWCHDHALRVLVRLFSNKGLQESFLHPHDPNGNPYVLPPRAQTLIWRDGLDPIPGEPNNWTAIIWTSLAREALQDYWEREHQWPSRPGLSDSREVLRWWTYEDHEPEKFTLEDSEFSDDGWNYLDESLTEFQRRVEVNFLGYLIPLENRWLANSISYLSSRQPAISDDEHTTVLKWRSRQFWKLRRALRIYLRSMNEHKQEALGKGHLTSYSFKPKLEHHLRLAIQYQVPTASFALKPMSSLGKPSSVTKFVDEALELIDLKKRPPNETGGRKRGSKNRLRASARLI
jgi:hypothetical protein